MSYYDYMNSPRRHTPPNVSRRYNRAVGVMTHYDYVFVLHQLEKILERIQQENVADEYIVELKGLIWRVEQTGRLTR